MNQRRPSSAFGRPLREHRARLLGTGHRDGLGLEIAREVLDRPFLRGPDPFPRFPGFGSSSVLGKDSRSACLASSETSNWEVMRDIHFPCPARMSPSVQVSGTDSANKLHLEHVETPSFITRTPAGKSNKQPVSADGLRPPLLWIPFQRDSSQERVLRRFSVGNASSSGLLGVVETARQCAETETAKMNYEAALYRIRMKREWLTGCERPLSFFFFFVTFVSRCFRLVIQIYASRVLREW